LLGPIPCVGCPYGLLGPLGPCGPGGPGGLGGPCGPCGPGQPGGPGGPCGPSPGSISSGMYHVLIGFKLQEIDDFSFCEMNCSSILFTIYKSSLSQVWAY